MKRLEAGTALDGAMNASTTYTLTSQFSAKQASVSYPQATQMNAVRPDCRSTRLPVTRLQWLQ